MEAQAQAAEALIARTRGQDSLNAAIDAIGLYMKAADAAPTKAEASRLRRKCRHLIVYAENLKQELNPEQFAQQKILLDASRLCGNQYPQWKADPSEQEFNLRPSEQLFVDDASIPLSETQRNTFNSWMRPREIFAFSEDDLSSNDEAAIDAALMSTDRHIDLVQDITTDCSVVASLSAAVEILTGKHSVLSTIIYPFDHVRGRPKYSASGKYVLKLNFNGCHRRVVIDDRLPASTDDGNFFVVDRSNQRLLWPALIEKAYLKVRGGYDFPGSNSGTDLWVITGWIPEQIFLQKEELDINQLWKRIKGAYDLQDVVITVGTGCISVEEERATGFVGEHDYSVQELHESAGVRRLLVKNPWCGWPLRKLTAPDTETTTVQQGLEAQLSRLALDDNHKSDGCLWVTLEDVAQNFESMYLNWNPKLFSHCRHSHFRWDLPPRLIAPTLVQNPQYSMTSPAGGLVWILVSRHFADAELDILRHRSTKLADTSRRLGYMSILVFDSKGERVQIVDGETYRGPYVDSPQTLARLDTTAGKRYTVVLDQHELPLSTYTFTMSAFSNSPLEVQQAAEPLPYSKEITGAWTRRTAGGRPTSATYFSNPQYRITVSAATPISVLLATDNRGIYVHFDLVWSHGKRVNTAKVKELLASSGEYRRGSAVARIPLVDPGIYTLVCSTFEADQLADFMVRITSRVPVKVDVIPAEAAGKIRTILNPLSLSEEVDKLRAPLSVDWLARASVSVRKSNAGPTSSEGVRYPSSMLLRLSVAMGRGPEQVTIAVSEGGEFQEPTVALQTPEFDIEPDRVRTHGMWLIVEGVGLNSSVQAIEGVLYSDSPVQIGPWEQV